MPIVYASRTLNPTERSYSVTERESLAIIFGLKKFRHTILGFKVQVITDHKPNLDLFKKNELSQIIKNSIGTLCLF